MGSTVIAQVKNDVGLDQIVKERVFGTYFEERTDRI